MRRATLGILLVISILAATGCKHTGIGQPSGKAIMIVNSKAVDQQMVNRLRSFAEAQLNVPVRTSKMRDVTRNVTELYQCGPRLVRAKASNDVCLIALVSANGVGAHLAILVNTQTAVVNVAPLRTADTEVFARRVERQVMRGAGFLFGLEPSRDPYCVTRQYSTLEELDQMGRNFFPPWRSRFEAAARARGLPSAGTTTPGPPGHNR